MQLGTALLGTTSGWYTGSVSRGGEVGEAPATGWVGGTGASTGAGEGATGGAPGGGGGSTAGGAGGAGSSGGGALSGCGCADAGEALELDGTGLGLGGGSCANAVVLTRMVMAMQAREGSKSRVTVGVLITP